MGATGALLLALARGALTFSVLQDISRSTLYTTSMVFLILIGAAIFSLVFRGFGGDALIEAFFEGLGGGPHMALLVVMLVMFLLGFILTSSRSRSSWCPSLDPFCYPWVLIRSGWVS
ncbi:MAG: hypothetical protein CM15mP74_13040 [Halieaceae bacterium]|nr:MAG: hypothetical protein CM15mP74_13040 [Halieaceae bacterium]